MASSMRNRLAGGAVLGIAALAFYLGMNFKGPGLGGGGAGVGVITRSTEDGQPAPPVSSEIVGDDELMVASAGSLAQPPAWVTVVVDDPDYRLSTKELGDARPASLGEVAQAASLTTGDGQGIRVRIYKSKAARAGTLIDLQARLSEMGLKPESIQVVDEFLPE